jgi:hypothetical protein
MEKIMNNFEKNIAVTRGESLSAQLLAVAAIQAICLSSSDPVRILSGISAFIDDTLNNSGPAKGDSNDDFNTQLRETARFQAMQLLDAFRLSLQNELKKKKNRKKALPK